jgi:DsbC/DsbD-like thiol-disulfide interchange protein
MRSFLRPLILVAGLAVVALASAQGGTPPVVSLKVAIPKVMAGKAFQAVVTITFPEGLHGYQNPPTDPSLIPITVTAADRTCTVLKVSYPKGVPTQVGGESKPINVYQGTVKIPVSIQAPAKLGKALVKLSIGYQECNAQSCFPPGTATAEATVTVIKKTSPPKLMVGGKGKR